MEDHGDDDDYDDIKDLPEITLEELSRHRGADGGKILVGVKRRVFDVSKGRGFYGEGGAYSIFAGNDATRALALGSLEESVVANRDIADLTVPQQMKIDDWLESFSSKYELVAKLPAPPSTKKKLKTSKL